MHQIATVRLATVRENGELASLSGEMKEDRPTLAQTGLVWFLRLMAVSSMVFGIAYWAQLIGVAHTTIPRFDLLPLHWQVPCVVLAVLFPCASMGLWMLTSWGVVLWAAAIGIEIGMYGVWSQTYVAKPQIVISHSVSLAVLLLFLGIVLAQRLRRRINDY
jgi:hypothetical protein